MSLVATDYAQNSSRSVARLTVTGVGREARISRAIAAHFKPTAPTPKPNAPALSSALGQQSQASVRCWFGKSARQAELHVGGQHVELFEGFLRIDGKEITPCNGLPAAQPIALSARGEQLLVAFRDGSRSLYHAGVFEPALELTKAEQHALAAPARPHTTSNVFAGELPSSHISALETFQNQLIVGSFDGGAFSIDEKHELRPIAGAPRFINALLAEPDRLWLASATGLFQLSGAELREIPLDLAASHVNGLARASDGTLWLATRDGLLGFRAGQWRRLDQSQGLPSRIVYAVSEGPDGTLWAGTAAGVARIAKDGVRIFSVENGALPHRWVTALLADAEGSYVGTYQGGVTRLDASGARSIAGTESLWLNPHGLERLGSRLYAASMGGGLVAFAAAPGTRSHEAIRLGPLPSTDVTAVKTFAGALWVGTRAGLARLPQ